LNVKANFETSFSLYRAQGLKPGKLWVKSTEQLYSPTGVHLRAQPIPASAAAAAVVAAQDELFRRAVPSRATVRLPRLLRVELGSLAEVCELGDAIAHKDILGFDVAVRPRRFVAMREPLQDVAAQVEFESKL
jgi:hypothetical protein